MSEQPYIEENFGILTDDDLYLDAILVKPANLTDETLRALRVWVPKYPLTKSSVLTCARQEVKSYGGNGRIAHLVFDLRGTGESEGTLGRQNFKLDLDAVIAWAEERFGKINFGFLGTPTLRGGRVNVWPLRAGTVLETYSFSAVGAQTVTPPTVIYLSTYGHFGRLDEKYCAQLAAAGYEVHGLDPLRYLLQASAQERLTPEQLAEDWQFFLHMLPAAPLVVVGQPMGAGLGLVWAADAVQVGGVVAIGRAETGLQPPHIFANDNPSTFRLTEYVGRLGKRPLALVQLTGHPLGGDEAELKTLFQTSQEPHRYEVVPELDAELLVELVGWSVGR
jgi:pimeloyl-ACP methyl ester carboxylesterase